MTRMLVIYNLSNHENEDFDGSKRERARTRLAPGEKILITGAQAPGSSVDIKATAVTNPDKPAWEGFGSLRSEVYLTP